MLWGLEWHSRNRLDGETRYLLWNTLTPLLYRSRQEAREDVTRLYGYIRDRPDLRAEPHGWRMPRPVRVEVTVKVVGD